MRGALSFLLVSGLVCFGGAVGCHDRDDGASRAGPAAPPRDEAERGKSARTDVPEHDKSARHAASALLAETPAEHDARMAWWREARFGLFIHWGLYAIPAGEWKGETNHAEWIRHSAEIPVETYDQFVGQFNPTKFDADAWARLAKTAGMKYVVITSKHHDGFCLFDSQETDFDVMATPFRRDILRELADATRRQGLRICWYHSIMDWHHPDYLPRRGWEADTRPVGDADMHRYVTHLQRQLRELVTNYGPIGVLWFDGQWEETWTHERGVELYKYVRGLDPDIIINNRVDVGRSQGGLTQDAKFVGDFGTPEQEIPATGLPGVDWESCITMNDHWGFNRHDAKWKSSRELIRMLVDVASKGGNLLLNVGPTASGEFPPEAVERLERMGQWMRVNGDAIHGTQAGPFGALPWGRCTMRSLRDGHTRLFLHVFDWPPDGRVRVPGLLNNATRALLMTNASALQLSRDEDAVVIAAPMVPPDPDVSVIVLDIAGKPDVAEPPRIHPELAIFVNETTVALETDSSAEIRYTLDGSVPSNSSPRYAEGIRLTAETNVRARLFRGGRPVSGTSERTYRPVPPRPAATAEGMVPGVAFAYFEGKWELTPDFAKLTPVETGVLPDIDISGGRQKELFGYRFIGYLQVPRDGVYMISTVSDDGSRLYIDGDLCVDNDGLHAMIEKKGHAALAAGMHSFMLDFFERTGLEGLELWIEGPGLPRQRVGADMLWRRGSMTGTPWAPGAGAMPTPLLTLNVQP